MNLDLSSRQGAAQVPGWKRRWTFLLAATGSAFGLGNIWKLPYIIGENGGGAFVLVFLLCILLIGVPIMMAMCSKEVSALYWMRSRYSVCPIARPLMVVISSV